MPFLVSVTKLHCCPPVTIKPFSQAACANSLTLTEDVAIGLAIVGRGAGTEKIGLEVTRQSCRAHFALEEHAEAALATSEVILG